MIDDIEPINEDGFPRDIRRKINEIIDVVNHPFEVGETDSTDIRSAKFLRSKSKTKLLLPNTGRRSSTAFNQPWQVKINNFGTSDSPRWKFIIYRGSRLCKSERSADTLTVPGLASDFVPKDNDSGWTAFSLTSFPSGVRVWLECELNNDPDLWPGTPTPSIQFDGGPNTFDGGEFEYENEGSTDNPQYINTVSRAVIAFIYDPVGDGKLIVDQWVRTHLFMGFTSGTAYDSSNSNPQAAGLFCFLPA